ncbi:MAG: DUF3459 domain-containing protein, partial [Candidatus Dormibacteraeota bacterium]|nr:DUF3459 domain-containing protein [Candidatus Dormibacteraeota bacterium]
SEQVFAFERAAGGERLLVALNFGGEPARLAEMRSTGRRLLSTNPALPAGEVSLDGYELGPLEGSVFALSGAAGPAPPAR